MSHSSPRHMSDASLQRSNRPSSPGMRYSSPGRETYASSRRTSHSPSRYRSYSPSRRTSRSSSRRRSRSPPGYTRDMPRQFASNAPPRNTSNWRPLRASNAPPRHASNVPPQHTINPLPPHTRSIPWGHPENAPQKSMDYASSQRFCVVWVADAAGGGLWWPGRVLAKWEHGYQSNPYQLSVQYFHGIRMGTARAQIAHRHTRPYTEAPHYIRSVPDFAKLDLTLACFSVHEHIRNHGSPEEKHVITSEKFSKSFSDFANECGLVHSSVEVQRFLANESFRQYVSGRPNPPGKSHSESKPVSSRVAMKPSNARPILHDHPGTNCKLKPVSSRVAMKPSQPNARPILPRHPHPAMMTDQCEAQSKPEPALVAVKTTPANGHQNLPRQPPQALKHDQAGTPSKSVPANAAVKPSQSNTSAKYVEKRSSGTSGSRSVSSRAAMKPSQLNAQSKPESALVAVKTTPANGHQNHQFGTQLKPAPANAAVKPSQSNTSAKYVEKRSSGSSGGSRSDPRDSATKALPSCLVKCASLVTSFSTREECFDAEIETLRKRKRQVEQELKSKRRQGEEHEAQYKQLEEEHAADQRQSSNALSFKNEQNVLCEKLQGERKKKEDKLKKKRNRRVILESRIATLRLELSQLQGKTS